MKPNAVSGIMLTLLLIVMMTSTLTFNIQPVKAQGTIYIRSDGSIDPATAPIGRDGDIYTLTGNIYTEGSGVVIERDNMTIDGATYLIQGAGIGSGIILSSPRHNVTIRNTKIENFTVGISLDGAVWFPPDSYYPWAWNCYDNSIIDNLISTNTIGVDIDGSTNNKFLGNNITDNERAMTICALGDGSIRTIYPHDNVFDGNNIINSAIAMDFSFWGGMPGNWHNNYIYHNNFVNISSIMFCSEPGWVFYDNVWDDGYPSGGNHWSDYSARYPSAQELDNSGIWNTPYIIDENNIDRYPLMNPWARVDDVAVVSVVPSVTEVYVGQVVNVTVVARNEGSVRETFEVSCKYELEGVEHTIDIQTITDLAPSTTATLTFTWTTADVTDHIIKAEIQPLASETDTADNVSTSPILVKVKIFGDVNNDGEVNTKDLSLASKAFGSRPGNPKWNPQADVNQDNKVDIKDIALIAKHFGETYP